MNQRNFANLGILIVVAITVIFLSWISMNIWGSNKVEAVQLATLQYNQNSTLKEFATANKLPEKVVLKVFNLKDKASFTKKLAEFQVSQKVLLTKINEALAIYAESLSKNWTKIYLKFVLWFLFLALIYVLIRKKIITPRNRKWFYLSSFVLFGIILGSDPSPMGTIKDAITLYAMHHVLFIPRFIALAVFLFLVVSVNKFICAWGCQLGTLQDFIFRLNRNKRDTKGLVKQYKVPFAISNAIRIGFFVLFTVIAFVWVFDIVEYVDPFKIFNPQVVNVAGWIFIGLILLTSLFVYRPWCHFFCPFGLFGWIFERFSFVKIKVKYSDCISCDACSKACPSTVMDTILKQDRTIPDCFACGICISVCPTNAISLAPGKREKVPEGKFDKK